MSLRIYETADPADAYSISGDFTHPISFSFDILTGGVTEKQFYLRNDGASYTYSGVQITPVDSIGKHLVDGTAGFGWKLSSGSDRPTESAWGVIDYGDTISMSGISDTNTYLPFWVRVEAPRGQQVTSYNGVVLRIEAEETGP